LGFLSRDKCTNRVWTRLCQTEHPALSAVRTWRDRCWNYLMNRLDRMYL
jgi:hypothetical protein